MTSAITVGVFDHLDDSGAPLASQYADRLRLVEACDRAGLHAYHVAEHHGTPHGFASSPNVFLAAASQRTGRLRLGPMVMQLPLYHPLRAFEEICMLDQISGGRLDLGIGRGGVPMEHAYFGVAADEADEQYREISEIILQAMGSRELNYEGKYFRFRDVPLVLSPFQKPRPALWCGTANPMTGLWAARSSVNVISIGAPGAIRQLTDGYRQEWDASAKPADAIPFLGMIRMIVIAETEERAYTLAAPAYARWFDTLTALWRRHDTPAPYKLPSDIIGASDAGICLIGTSKNVTERLLIQAAETRVNYLSAHVAFGDLPVQAAISTVESLAADVIPHLHVK